MICLGTGKCPASHPYAYNNGKHCCAYNREKHYRPQGHKCDGSKISISSLCCLNDKHVRCQYEKCVRPGKFLFDLI